MYKPVHIERGVQRLADNYVIEMLHITKEFPGIKANDDITLQLRKGEIHALLGENGAGKSTLMSVLFGLYQPEQGTIRKNGQEVKINNPNDANALGIGMVHQHFKLVECFTVLDNIILGVEDTKHGFLQKDEARKKVMALSEKYGLKVDPDALVSDISVGMQQRVEILKMLYREAEILIFDEPTAVLTPQETQELFDELLHLKENGYTIIFISHKLQEIKQKYGDERHTRIENVADEIDIEDLIEQQDCAYTLTHFGYIKRQPTSVYRAQRRGGRGVSAMSTREEDFAKDIFTASTHDTVLLGSRQGLQAEGLPDSGDRTFG